jgi:hypothetical protein
MMLPSQVFGKRHPTTITLMENMSPIVVSTSKAMSRLPFG